MVQLICYQFLEKGGLGFFGRLETSRKTAAQTQAGAFWRLLRIFLALVGAGAVGGGEGR